MRILVCGMHRSGTSAIARLLAKGTGLSLYDDPLWARFSANTILNNQEVLSEISRVEILKCPRMAGYLSSVLRAVPAFSVIWMLRDPRDVYASIQERVVNSPNTSLLDFSEIGIEGTGIQSFVDAYAIYLKELSRAISLYPDRVMAVEYERFFRAREGVVADIAKRLGIGFNTDAVSSLAAEQLGPVRHKFGAIRGPGRHTADLNETERQALQSSAESWSAAKVAFC